MKVSECSDDQKLEKCNELCGKDEGCFVECGVMEAYPAIKDPELTTIWLPAKLIIIAIFLATVGCIAGGYKCCEALWMCFWEIREKGEDDIKAILV